MKNTLIALYKEAGLPVISDIDGKNEKVWFDSVGDVTPLLNRLCELLQANSGNAVDELSELMQFKKWFQSFQGVEYEGMYTFAHDAWMARASLANKPEGGLEELQLKRAIYENVMIAISHAKIAPKPFDFLSNQIEAMFNTEFSVRNRTANKPKPEPTAQFFLNNLDDTFTRLNLESKTAQTDGTINFTLRKCQAITKG